ncbi:MAG TPA: hypothetical protein VFG04_10295 [Planctomycetaceae bacterium]|jgi:hypothetical protein|nr:hypothetical protein [Planctomycetaceae bacterium]
MQSVPSVATPSRSLRGTLRQFVEDVSCAGRIARGMFRYSRTGTTPSDAYHSLIHLYCRTNGRSNDFLHALARRRFPQADLPAARGVLGDLSSADVKRIVADIRENGFIRPAERLPAEVCQRLSAFSLRTEATLTPARKEGPSRAVYDPARPIAEGYRFDEATVVEQPDIQALMADPSLLAVAQAYLGCLPVLSSVVMLWSTPARLAENAREELAQMYHFDMDRLKWLKFFFYLTEVTSERGPHCFIAKSHRTGRQLPALLARGYVRYPDQELEPYFPAADRIELTGPAGTLFAVDTRGYHKGITPRTGDRLMLQLEFCDMLFGAPYSRPPFPTTRIPELESRRRDFPRVYSRYQ